MRLIVGLGNPGEKYEATRHNVGFVVVDNIARHGGKEWLENSYTDSMVIRENEFVLAKPLTFMNSSGVAVNKLLKFFELQPEDMIVVHDDLDITLGEYKIQFAKGPKVHNGVNSIENHLGTDKFWRARVGVENRDPENRIPGESYVLQKMPLLEVQQFEYILPDLIKDVMNINNG